MKKYIVLLCSLFFLSCDFAGYPYYLRRENLNLCITIDVSGSMTESIEDAKTATSSIVDVLNQDDILSIVLFNSSSNVLLESQYVEDKESIKASIATIAAGGGTMVSSGLTQGYAQMDTFYTEGIENTLLLICDGDVDPSSLPLVTQAYSKGIRTSAIALGERALVLPLTEIANAGHGSFYKLEKSTELSGAFLDEINNLLSPID